jgi:hypothetical protein
MKLTTPAKLMAALPSAAEIDRRISHLLRELHLARRLRRLAALADQYRAIEVRQQREARHAD